MSGIDKIIQQIEADTKAVCDEVVLSAHNKADDILTQAKIEADQIAALSQKKTAEKVSDIEKRGLSAADLERRKIALKTKQGIINDMLITALDYTKSLPDEEYFDLLLTMIKNNSQPIDGEIVLCAADKARMPADFMKKVGAAAKGKLTLSDDNAAISSGFILRYGGVEENCSFDAVFMSEAENLSDKAGKLLF